VVHHFFRAGGRPFRNPFLQEPVMSHAVARSAASALIVFLGCLATSVADDTDAKSEPRVDFYGDPLPDGAVARLGTVRYRACAGAGRIEFLADGRTLLGCDDRRLVWLDVPTGETIKAVDIEGDSATLLAVTKDRSLAAVNTRTRLPDLDESVSGTVFVDTTTGNVRSRLDYSGETARFGFTAACFTPDGVRLVTGDHEGVLRVWSVSSGREKSSHVLATSDEVKSIDVSFDDQWVITSQYRAAYRWQWRTAKEPISCGRPDERVVSVALAPDGRTVATGADQYGDVRLFDVETGREIRKLTAPGRYYYPDQMAFTSDGSMLAVPSYNRLIGAHPESPGELDVWDVESGELVRALPFPEGLRRVAISPDDRWIAAGVYEGTIAAWDLVSGQSVSDGFFGHVNRFGTLAVSPDGTQIATAGNSGLAVLWDAKTGRAVHVLRHHPGKIVWGLAFSPDGNLVATSAFDDTVVIWNRETGERVYTLQGHGELGGMRAVGFTPDSGRLLSFGDDWFLRVFDVQTGKALLEHAIRPSGLPLKSNVYGSVNLQDDERLLLSLTPAADFTADGKSMVLSAGPDLYVFDVETGTERRRSQSGLADQQFALSADGTRLAALRRESATENADGAGSSRTMSIQIMQLGSGEVKRTIPIPDAFSARMAFSPDGSKLATTSDVIRVYDTTTGREVARIEPQIRASYGVTFTPDGERLVVCHADTTALIWEWRRFLIDEEADR
jgi:WD40 repeat protein